MMDHDEGASERTPRRAGITSIADATHTSRARAGAILKSAGMRKSADGKFVYDKAVAVILASIDPARSTGHQAGGDDSALDDATAGTIGALSNAKADYEAARTRKMQIEIAKLEGKLVDREAVTARAIDLAIHVRAGLAGVGAKTAADLAATSDAAQAQAIVDTAIHDALTRLSSIEAYILGEAPS